MHKKKLKYVFVLIIYVLSLLGITAVFVSSLLSNLKDNDQFFTKINNGEAVVELVIEDQFGFGIMLESDYLSYGEKNKAFINHIYTIIEDEIYYIITNSYATNIMTSDAETSYLELINNQLKLKEDIATKILHNEITTWENGSKIQFYSYALEYHKRPHSLINIGESLILKVNFYKVDSNGDFILDELGGKIVNEILLPTSDYNAVFQTLYYLIMFIPMLIILLPDLKSDYKRLRQTMTLGQYLSKTLIGWLILMGFVVGANLFVNLLVILGYNAPAATNQIILDRSTIGDYKWLMVFTITLMGPFVEEFVFRKSIFELISNEKVALVVSALVFGLIHITTEIMTGDILLILATSANYIFAGFAFGYIYIKNDRNIFIVTGAHVVNNALSVIPILTK